MKSRLKHPHQPALLNLAGLVGLSLLVTLTTWGLSIAGFVEASMVWIGLIFLAFFSLMFLIIWIMGANQMRCAQAFLDSERVLVGWTYSTPEWQRLKETRWQEEKNDWKVQLGCLTFLLALAGLLTGILLGWEDGFLAVIARGLVGLMLGGLIGGVFGILVAGSNQWSAHQAYRNPEPGLIALGVNEIYASADYFRGDGRVSYIREAKLQPGENHILELQLVFPPRIRMPDEEQWNIPVPLQWLERVQEILPVLAAPGENRLLE
jgi:hypothetical protein